MKLTSTNLFGVPPLGGSHAIVAPPCLRIFVVKSPRGTAEIELLLVIPILLAILFLAGGSLKLGAARLANVYNAENDAYAQVVSGRGFFPSSDPAPFEGFDAPLLPNRFALADENLAVPLTQQQTANGNATIHFNDRAIFLDPSWHYSSWPQTGDRPAIQAWFDAYVAESHPPDLVQSLGLQPPTPP